MVIPMKNSKGIVIGTYIGYYDLMIREEFKDIFDG